jgi:hypothetical protein
VEGFWQLVRDVVIRQVHEAGRMGLSDFTEMDGLGITVAGVALDHRLYHCRLACSGFEHAHVILGGESYVEGLLANARSRGAPPSAHRAFCSPSAARRLTAGQ